MDFDISKTTAKNILVYRTFNKEKTGIRKPKNVTISILIKYRRTGNWKFR